MGVLGLTFFWRQNAAQIASGGNDFLAFYAGGRLAGSADLYDTGRIVEVQEQAAGFHGGGVLSFIRPPYYAALLWPLAQLPYYAAYLIWQALCLGAVAAFVVLWPDVKERAILALASCWSLPLSASFANGQDTVFLVLWIVLALRNMDRRPWLAGFLMSLCVVKFQFFVFIPVFVLAQKRWRFGLGLFIGGAALLAASFAAGGRDWIPRYLTLITSARTNPSEAIMPNLHGLTWPLPHATWFELALSVIVLAAVWIGARRFGVEAALAIVLVGGALVSRHAYVQDCLILLPACMILQRSQEPPIVRRIAWLLFLPILYIPSTSLRPSLLIAALPLSLLVLLFAKAVFAPNPQPARAVTV